MEVNPPTRARTQKQPECPSTDEWVKKMGGVHTHTAEYYSGKKESLSLGTCMDLGHDAVISQRKIRAIGCHL